MATALVFLMQPGFACLESGLCRAKNTINVAAKNLTDFIVVTLIYWAAGFGMMFGPSLDGMVGVAGFAPDTGNGDRALFFLFELMFCATAVTIVSGALAERTRFGAYVWISLAIAGLIYPVSGHWVWNDDGWLKALGFHDFAGSTVVHSTGGWIALAGCLVVGPRLNRFGPDRIPMRPSNLVLSVIGCLLIWLGWIGFNGGSTLAWNDKVGGILLVTTLGGAAGCLGGLVLSAVTQRTSRVGDLINGVIGGLVAVTAGADMLSSLPATLVGASAGMISVAGKNALDRLGVDDPVGAIPAHLFCGIWGTLALVFLAPESALPTGNRVTQLVVQLVGIVSVGAFCFIAGVTMLLVLNRLSPIRVSAKAEEVGLNISEHDASTATNDLLVAMEWQRRTGNFEVPAPVERGTAIGDIAQQYNLVLRRVQDEVGRREEAAQEARRAQHAAEGASKAKSDFLANMSHELRTPLNAIIGFSDLMDQKVFGPVGNASYEGYVQDIKHSGEHLLGIIQDILDLSKAEQNRLDLDESDFTLPELFAAVTPILDQSARSKQIDLVFESAENLPVIRADRRMLSQVLLNLAGNSVKFTETGGSVRVSASREDDGRLAIAVIDTGVGLTREQIDRALEPFTQVHSAIDRPVPGTGLGLPLARAMTLLHDATFTLTSKPGVGTRVTIRLPRHRIIEPADITATDAD